jgi:O-antigen/teichoic acid export membrane protein
MKSNFVFSSLSVFSRLLTGFLLLFCLARLLSVEHFGVFTYSLVFSNILVLIVEYGYNLKLSKDTAKNPEKISELVFMTVRVKGFLILPLLLVVGVLWGIGFIEFRSFQILLVLTISAIFNSFANHFLIPYRSINKFNVETIYVFINNLSILCLVIYVAYIYNDLLFIAITFMCVKFLFMIATFFRFKKDFGISFEKLNLKKELIEAFPYAIHIGVGTMYLNIDTLILKEYVGDYQIGIYQAGMRALVAATIGLAVISTVLVPKLASLSNDRKKLIDLAGFYNKYIIVFGLCVALFVNIFDKELIYLVFGEKFTDLIQYVFLFSLVVFMRYFGTLYGTLLTISDKQRIRTIGVTITLFLIIILDLFLIPVYGLYGALYSLIIAHILLNGIYMYFAHKEYKTFYFKR